MSTYAHIIKYFSTHPWAIEADRLDAIVGLIRLHVAGGRLGADDIQARLAAARSQQGERKGDGLTGIIPIYGTIMPHANVMTEMSGGTTVDGVRGMLHAAMGDPDISRVIFDIDSGGGSVEGITELAAEIRAARGIKPMTAIANYSMGSAAYWLGVQADEVVASPSAIVGSVGVYGVHEDWSEANAKAGVQPTYIASSQFKVEGNPDAPLSTEAAQHMQSLVDASADQFIRDVAAARGIAIKAVQSGFGEGRAFHPAEALARGMIDRIASFDEVRVGKAPRMKARRQEAAETFTVTRLEYPGVVTQAVVDDQPYIQAIHDALPAALAEAAASSPDVFDFERERRSRLLKPA